MVNRPIMDEYSRLQDELYREVCTEPDGCVVGDVYDVFGFYCYSICTSSFRSEYEEEE